MTHPLRHIICRFDRWLSRQLRVQVFTDDPQCLMRIQVWEAPLEIALPVGAIPREARVLMLHMWNERAPLIPEAGPDLGWALDTRRRMIHSLRLVARHIQYTPALQDVQAVGGITPHVTLIGVDGGKAMLDHLGFAVFPYYRPLGEFGKFWENFYTWWLMWTFNPISVRHRQMWNLQRTEFWMGTEEFLEKYGR